MPVSISAPPKVGKHSFALSIHYNLPFLKNWFRGRHRCLLALCRLYIYQCKSVLFCFCIFLSRPCFTSKICFVMAHVWTFLLLFLLSHPEYALLWLMFGLSTPFTFSTSRICCVMNMFWVFSYIFTFYVSEADICSTAHRIIVFLSSKKFANFFYFSKNLLKKIFFIFQKNLLTNAMYLYIIINVARQHRTNIEVWLSLVERCVRDAEVAGSNPVTSIFLLP